MARIYNIYFLNPYAEKAARAFLSFCCPFLYKSKIYKG